MAKLKKTTGQRPVERASGTPTTLKNAAHHVTATVGASSESKCQPRSKPAAPRVSGERLAAGFGVREETSTCIYRLFRPAEP